MKQRMVSRCRRGSVTFWAWGVSITVHLAVLTIFGVVSFPHSQAADEQRPAPTAKISRVEKFIQAAPVIPKPRVKRLVRENITERGGTKAPERLVSPNPAFNTPKPVTQNFSNSFSSTPSVEMEWSSLDSVNLPSETELFGSRTEERKVCYVVDSSGSMQGIFGWVQDNLKKSIEALQPDEYFCVIVFGGDRILESGSGRLVRATEQAKKEAYGFIDSIRPAGTTNAMAAMERAVKVRDSSGAGPGLIYFLTDGFELGDQDASRFGDRISVMLRSFAPKMKVNTIGFWPEKQDRRLLEAIARESGGESILITDVDEQTNANN
jgi:hypothetical protein